MYGSAKLPPMTAPGLLKVITPVIVIESSKMSVAREWNCV